MDLHEALGKLTANLRFKEWHEQNPDCFLAHGFMMLDEANKDQWQIGFYDPKTGKMKTFIVSENIQQMEEQEILKKGELAKLELSNVQINQEDAMAKAEECFKKYKQVPLKTFFIVQQVNGKTVYNVTFFTQAFNTVNIKVSALDGEILEETEQKLATFG
ncbi:PepSY domain-containing protein [Candidatus Woesearchaeota archaeon]|nr:PepSY domain-containing protein [Candidatus Woesearchaeota archaeon]